MFADTAYKSSNQTIAIYACLVILSPIIFITAIILANVLDIGTFLVIVQAILLAYGMFISVVISALFVYKLVTVNNNVSSDCVVNNSLLHVVTKHTILAVTSFLCTLCVMVLFVIISAQRVSLEYATNLVWILSYAILMDAYSNLICISLSFACFEGIYFAICGCVDAKCRRAMQSMKRVDGNQNDYQLMQL